MGVVVATRARRDPTERAALLAAMRGLGRVARARRPVPPGVERDLRLLE